MKQFISFVHKETRHIMRDKRTMLVLFGMPVVLMLLFGFAISTDVRNVRTIVVTLQQDYRTQSMVEALSANEYFNILYNVSTAQEAEMLIRNQKADIAIVFAHDFGNFDMTSADNKDNAMLQIITDGTDPNMAQLYSNYATQILASHLNDDTNAGMQTSPVSTKLLYNPQMKSAYNFVPGIMGMLMMLICAMMTSISIVREKERGNMEVLLVSPVRPLLIIIAKAVPYLVLALVILCVILGISKFVLGVPLSVDNLGWILALSTIYILLALSLGLFISTIARTQLVALIISAMVLLMPCIMLSGMMFPIESMPQVLQWISAVVPPRYYISAMRKLMVMGVTIDKAATEAGVLVVMTLMFMVATLLKFNKRLE